MQGGVRSNLTSTKSCPFGARALLLLAILFSRSVAAQDSVEPGPVSPEPTTVTSPAAPELEGEAQVDAASFIADLQASSEAVDLTPDLLRFYGFMDAGLQRAWGGLFQSGLSQSDALMFVVGNVNLYVDVTPSPEWRGLAEVRFTTFPDGAETFNPTTGQFTAHDTTILDYTSPQGGFLNVHWGGIILERAHIDWLPHDLFNLRIGLLLTPYGIWNVDHGTPTRIMLTPPTFVAYGLLPERQTGLEIFGVAHFLPWKLGYHLYLTNGRAVSVDFSDDKAIGGRLYLQTHRPVGLQLGVSAYYGTYQNVQKMIGLNDGVLGVVRTTNIEYEELAGGADLSLDVGGLRVRSEFVINRTVFEPGKRAQFGGIPRVNSTSYNAYIMFAYRLPWFGLEPLIYSEFIHLPYPGVAEYFAGVSGGVNVYLTPNVTLRTQAGRAEGWNGGSRPSPKGSYINYAAARLILAY